MTVKPKRKYLIFLFISLMVSAIIILDLSLIHEHDAARIEGETYTPIVLLPSESGVFERSKFALDYENMPDDVPHERILDTYYRNRAYAGAPPTIPHIVLNEKTMGDKSCLQCHQNGGFVTQFNAYAPVTPHPQFINCKQCHVPTRVQSLFRQSNFVKLAAPQINNQALEGSPPVIPHVLQMRENCLACHAGPAAPIEIRVSHPERVNCRQCHAAKPVVKIDWTRNSSELK